MIKNLGNAAGGGAGSVNFSAGGASANLASIVFSNSNGVSFGLAGSTVTASAAAGGVNIAASNSTFTSGTVVLSVGGGAMTISNGAQSAIFSVPATSSLVAGNANVSISTAGSTISIIDLGCGTGYTSGTTTGVVQAVTVNSNGISSNEPYMTRYMVPGAYELTALSAAGNASITFQYVSVPTPVTGSRIDALISHSGSSSATTNTCAIAASMYAAIYTRNAASLSSMSSGSTQTTWTYASNTAGLTDFTQAKMMPISVPVNFNMGPGEYIVGYNFITATSSIGLSTTNYAQTFSMMGGNLMQTAAVYGEIGSATAASVNLLSGMGVYSAASTGLSGAYSISGIVQTGSSLSQANIALVFRNA